MIKTVVSQKIARKKTEFTRKIKISLKFFRSAPEKFKFTSRKGPVLEYFVKKHALAVFKKVLESS